MRKNIDVVSILLGTLTLNLMIITGIIIFQDYQSPKNVLIKHPGGILLVIIILVLLLQIGPGTVADIARRALDVGAVRFEPRVLDGGDRVDRGCQQGQEWECANGFHGCL